MATKVNVDVWEDPALLGDKDGRNGYLLEAGDRYAANLLGKLAESICASFSDTLEVVGHDKRGGRLRLKINR